MLNSLQYSLQYFIELALYLIPLFIAATFLVGLIREYLDEDKIRRTLSGRSTFVSHLLASIFGAITPFCSCSTIPLLVGMLNSGVPFGISMSFLLTSPLANYVAIIMLATLLSWEVAALYIVFTIIMGMIGGVLLELLGLEKHVRSVSIAEDNLCSEGENPDGFKARAGNALDYALGFFRDLAPYLALGMVIGSLIHGFVPEEFIISIAGPQNLLAVPIAAVIGAPIYLSMEAMIPIAFSLYNLGMALGAVIALLMGGAGISIPNMVIIARIFKRKLLLGYALTIVVSASIIGYAFNILNAFI